MRARWTGAAILAAVATAAPTAACRRDEDPARREARLAELGRKTAELRERLERRLESESLVTQAAARKGNVLVALRSPFVGDVVRRLVAEYLDEVNLDLATDIRVRKDGEVKKETRLGTLRAGTWDLDLRVRRIRGVLAARPPQLAVSGTNRLAVELPVRVEGGEGVAAVRFAWDATRLASVVCGDFDTSLTLKARVEPREYTIAGAFVLVGEAESLVARPEFPELRLHLGVDLAPDSWAALRKVLEAQDRWTRCGIALDPDDVMKRVRELLARGFDVKLPRSLIGPLQLPTAVQRSVVVEGRTVDVAMRLAGLEVGPEHIWWGVDVHATGTSGAGVSQTP